MDLEKLEKHKSVYQDVKGSRAESFILSCRSSAKWTLAFGLKKGKVRPAVTERSKEKSQSTTTRNERSWDLGESVVCVKIPWRLAVLSNKNGLRMAVISVSRRSHWNPLQEFEDIGNWSENACTDSFILSSVPLAVVQLARELNSASSSNDCNAASNPKKPQF